GDTSGHRFVDYQSPGFVFTGWQDDGVKIGIALRDDLALVQETAKFDIDTTFFRQCIECCTQRSIPDDHELDAVLRFADGRRGDQIDWTLLWNQLPSETNSPWTGLSYRRPISCECILEKWSVNRIRRVVKF